jgi:fatty acid-binding protein DegV
MGAGALRLHPIVRYAGGSPAPVGITRSGARAAERIFRAWERSVVVGAQLKLVVFHSAREEQAMEIHRGVMERVPEADAHVVEVPASLAAHTGPGLLGLAWFWDN